MKLARFRRDGKTHTGVVEGNAIHQLKGTIFDKPEAAGHVFDLAEVKLLPPCEPSKIVVVGLNYLSHISEGRRAPPDEPVILLKAQTSLIGHLEPIVIPYLDHLTHYEGELVVVIGKECEHVKRTNALVHVLGYTCGNDVSDRTIQRKDLQWTRAKSFHTFCPLGPVIETAISDPSTLQVKTLVNGQVKQDAPTSDLLFDVPALIETTSAVMTLLPGDIIMTGTPGGVGPIVPGDTVEVSIEGVGTLSNPVVGRTWK
jgi:2-keto-4-pentenoate hydratase/2-oxohepta-3-ene-1,7-dioic acid hydratase in catechol pathway